MNTWIRNVAGPAWDPGGRAFKVSLIGAGKMARLHAEVLRSLPGLVLNGVSSRSEASCRKVAEEFGFRHYTAGFRNMLDADPPDVVWVCVSHAESVDVAREVLSRGIPCMLEKPVAWSAAETRELAELAARRRTPNMVALNRRYYSVVQQARLAVMHFGPMHGVLIEAHEPILQYRSRRQFDSWLYDQWFTANTIHAIDLFRMLGGEIDSVAGFGRAVSEPLGDHFSFALRHTSGMLGTFVAHFNSTGGFGLKIFGDGVTADLQPLESGYLQYAGGRRIKLGPDSVDLRYKAGLYAQNVAFLQSLADGERAQWPASDLADHVGTMELIEGVLSQTRQNSATATADV